MKKELKRLLPYGVAVLILYLCIHYFGTLERIIHTVIGAAVPLIAGCIIAYVVNILMGFYERVIFRNKNEGILGRLRTPVSMTVAYLTIVVIITAVIVLVVPQLVGCVELMISKFPSAVRIVIDKLTELGIMPDDIAAKLASIDWISKVTEYAHILISGLGSVAGVVTSIISSVFGAIVTAVIAIIFSIYALISKRGIFTASQKILAKYAKPRVYSRLVYVIRTANDCFRKYIIGQCTEAVILGVLCAIGMLIFRFPYVAMISSLIAFTALIPVAGAFIGGGVGAVMIFTVSPIKALLFIVFLLVLQQLENNIIFPKVVGTSIGMPSIWVLTAVTIGGGLAGVLGMIASVPIAATIYKIMKDQVLNDTAPSEECKCKDGKTDKETPSSSETACDENSSASESANEPSSAIDAVIAKAPPCVTDSRVEPKAKAKKNKSKKRK